MHWPNKFHLQIVNLVVGLESAATPDATDLETDPVHHDDGAVLVIVVAVVPVHLEAVKMEIVRVDVSLPCIGMFHHRASSILHHFNIKQCKQLVKFQRILLPTHRKQLYL